MRIAYSMLLAAGLLATSLASRAEEGWKVLMCNPAPTCTGECRPLALVRPQSATFTQGCNGMGSYQSYEFARRNADSFNGKPPSLGGHDSFGYSYSEAERLRVMGDWYAAQQQYRDAMAKATGMDEVLLVAEGLIAGGDVQAGITALTRARDLSSMKSQYTMVGDAFGRAGRPDQARICYERARDSTR